MVCISILGAIALIEVDRSGVVSSSLLESTWLYNGGGTGARTLLGSIAASSISVAGTVFSITIAALSLAAGQMGPRLLRNFTHDRGNQVTLGAFLATFSYALMVLRSVRTQDEGTFVPHLALSVAIFLAFVCVGMLVYFVGHMAGRINVDTVVELVSEDVRSAIFTLTTENEQTEQPTDGFWREENKSGMHAGAICSILIKATLRTGSTSMAPSSSCWFGRAIMFFWVRRLHLHCRLSMEPATRSSRLQVSAASARAWRIWNSLSGSWSK